MMAREITVLLDGSPDALGLDSTVDLDVSRDAYLHAVRGQLRVRYPDDDVTVEYDSGARVSTYAAVDGATDTDEAVTLREIVQQTWEGQGWITPNDCAYCGARWVSSDVPAVDDDEAWQVAEKDHAPGCAWIDTRAHRLEMAP